MNNTQGPHNITKEGSLSGSGLFLEPASDCTAGGDFCRQQWRVELVVDQCTLDGDFEANFEVCLFCREGNLVMKSLWQAKS